MKIAVVASYAPSLVNFRGALLASLVQDGHAVTAYAPDIDEATNTWCHARGIATCSIPLQRNGTNPRADLHTMTALMRQFRRGRPDVVFCYTVKPVIWGILAAALAGVPRRVAMITGLGHAFIDDDGPRSVVSRIVRGLYQRALRYAHVVIFHNDDDRQLFLHDGLVRDDGRAIVVPGSGVDLSRFAETPLPPVPPLRFLLITRLIAEKGVREFVEAARLVHQQHPDVEFRLVGPMDTNPSGVTEEEIAAWMQDGHVDIVGAVSDVRDELARCHVYVLPSYREGCPRTNLEAMAIGRPLLTTDVPGCRQTVTHHNGLLVPARDAQALAHACMEQIRHPERLAAMGRASRRLAVSTFGLETINAQMRHAIVGNDS